MRLFLLRFKACSRILMKTKNRVFIKTSSSLSCVGANNRDLFANICQGKSGIKQDKEYFFDASPAIGKFSSVQSFEEGLISQIQSILNQSQLKDFTETLLIIGSSVGGMQRSEEIFLQEKNYQKINPNFHHIHAISNMISKHFTFYDSLSFSTACTSSANALGYAHEVLSKGLYQNVLVVGADSLSKTTVGGFLTLGVLSSTKAQPFDKERQGMNVAEGIACLLLDTKPSLDSVEICAVGYSSDAHHIAHPHPQGEGAITAMSQALKRAGLESQEIDYINAHGTGTQANDHAEAHAITTLFPHRPFVSSTKAITGHTLGASGALEAIVSSLCILEQKVPINAFLNEAENENINLLRETKETRVNYVLSNSFAFGGNNCSLIFGRVK